MQYSRTGICGEPSRRPEPRPQYLSLLQKLIAGSKHVVVITGARRAGKSFLMKQAGAALVENGVPKENILFVNVEDPRFARLDAKLLTWLKIFLASFASLRENFSPV